jgi:hypothetical protein
VTPVFTPQSRRKLPLRELRFLPSVSEHLAESFHFKGSAPFIKARRLHFSTVMHRARNVIKPYNRKIPKLHNYIHN